MTFKIWGTENTINHRTSVDYDSITMLATGGYVVTWRENNKIAFQLYDGNGTTDNVTRFVDPPTAGNQQFSDAFAYDADGGFVITWTEGNGTTGRTLKNQKFKFNGDKDSDASELNTNTMNDGAQTSADFNAGQWATTYIQMIGSTKTVCLIQNGAVVEVTAGNVDRPDVAFLGGTMHVVSYQSDANGKVSFKLVNNGGIHPTTITLDGVRADVIGLKNSATGQPNGKFAVIVDKGAAGTEARIYDSADMSAAPTVFSLGGPKPDDRKFDYASGTALKNGGFAVVYIAADGPDFGDVYVRVIGADGVAGNPIKVNARASQDSAGSQRDPMISEMADGRLSVSWIDPAISDGSAPSIVTSTIVDARTAKVKVQGTSHNDVYAPSEHAEDTLNGAGGFDTLTFKESTAGVHVSLKDGKGYAGDATGDTYTDFERIIGSKFNDTLTGSAVANSLEGGAGDDTLTDVAGTGTDTLIGGAGNDTYYVNATNTVINEAGGGYDQVFSSVTYTLLAGIENLFATGGNAINLTGNELGNIITGNEAANRLTGNGGDDTLYGNGGDDVLDGGAGNDVLDGGTGNDYLAGGDGIDNLNGGIGNDTLDGGTGNDVLNGGDGFDSLIGGAGDDVLNGNGGADVMEGGDGNDVYYIDDLNDVVRDGSGVDTVYIAVDNYDISRLATIENFTGIGAVRLTLTGNAFNNTMIGNDGVNILKGGAGNDILNGGAGNDTLYGQEGKDILTGGSGRDIFVFDKKPNKSTNVDRITDFNSRDDSIYVENKYFKVGSGTASNPKKMASKYFYAGAKAHDKDDRFIYDKKKGILYYDKDGAGGTAQIKIATFDHKPAIKISDFFVI